MLMGYLDVLKDAYNFMNFYASSLPQTDKEWDLLSDRILMMSNKYGDNDFACKVFSEVYRVIAEQAKKLNN